MKRQDFLKTAAAAAFGFQFITRRVLGDATTTPPSRKINLAAIGCGGQAGSDLNNMQDENIVALCDVDKRHAGHVFKKYPNAKQFTDYRRMLDDAITHAVTGPGGQRGTATDSSATGSHPNAGTSEKPLPGPATLHAPPASFRWPRPFFAPLPPPCHSAEPRPQSSAVCPTTARTGAPSTGGNAAPLTQRGAMRARPPASSG